MKKKYALLSIIEILIIVMSFGLGYFYAYIHDLIKTMDMQVMTHSNILLTYSTILTQKLQTADAAGLIEATQENGNSLCHFIKTFKPSIKDPDTNKLAEIALANWEQAKERLQELRALQPENTKNGP